VRHHRWRSSGAVEPKDGNRVTSGVTQDGRMTSGIAVRAAGIPDC
jgi:hypothetical protein